MRKSRDDYSSFKLSRPNKPSNMVLLNKILINVLNKILKNLVFLLINYDKFKKLMSQTKIFPAMSRYKNDFVEPVSIIKLLFGLENT